MDRGIDDGIAEEVLSTARAKRLKVRRGRGLIFAKIVEYIFNFDLPYHIHNSSIQV